jgi:hypothetical protein
MDLILPTHVPNRYTAIIREQQALVSSAAAAAATYVLRRVDWSVTSVERLLPRTLAVSTWLLTTGVPTPTVPPANSRNNISVLKK